MNNTESFNKIVSHGFGKSNDFPEKKSGLPRRYAPRNDIGVSSLRAKRGNLFFFDFALAKSNPCDKFFI